MKKFNRIFLLLIIFFSIVSFLKAQNGWMRVNSENGEFSAEVPSQYDFFYDKDGFIVSDGSANSVALSNVHIFSAFSEKTLISFECYETNNKGADLVLDIDKQKMNVSEEKRGIYKIKQISNKDAEFYFIRQYFRSKNYLYIVTAASREGETPAIKRFLDSVVFDSTIASGKQNKSNFSKLRISQINLSIKEDLKYKTPASTAAKADDPNVLPAKILSKPRVSYVDAARMRAVQGALAMKIDLNPNGFIPKIVIVKSLPEGLLRQAVFSALRIRFLPSEKNGIPATVTKTLEYRFTLY